VTVELIQAILLAFAVVVILMPGYIRLIRWAGFAKRIRIEGPETHQVKGGTPTAGGALLIGVVGALALVFNLAILLGLMAYIGATMTLPGIAGFILTMGMGVDSNVLIFANIMIKKSPFTAEEVAKIEELTNPTADPIYLRRYQASEKQYRELALSNGFNGLFPLTEWGQIEGQHYQCKPVVV
jgi:hypothetical protein